MTEDSSDDDTQNPYQATSLDQTQAPLESEDQRLARISVRCCLWMVVGTILLGSFWNQWNYLTMQGIASGIGETIAMALWLTSPFLALALLARLSRKNAAASKLVLVVVLALSVLGSIFYIQEPMQIARQNSLSGPGGPMVSDMSDLLVPMLQWMAVVTVVILLTVTWMIRKILAQRDIL